MNLLEELKNLGVNVDEGVERLMGNASLYERMLFKFLDMMKKSTVNPDFDSDNYGDVIEVAHAIKGSAGNLSVTPIYEAYAEVVRLLRAGQPEQAKEVLKNIQPVQEEILNCIEKYV